VINTGSNQSVLLVLMTVFAVSLTLLLAYLFYTISGEEFRQVDLVLAIAAPLIIAPIGTWKLFGLLLQLDYLEGRMRELAFVDELTHLMTRRAFFESAYLYFGIAHRHGKTFGLLMVDLDNFKTINDRYGHSFGDDVLHTFGGLVNQMTRESDIVGRYGGDEFVFILPDTDVIGVMQYTEKLHSLVRRTSLEYDNEVVQFTISIGAAFFDDPNKIKGIKMLIENADHALYNAKVTGKNKTVVFKASQAS